MTKSSFPQSIAAENFPKRIQWTVKDTFALSLIPLIFILGFAGFWLNFSAYTVALIDVFIRSLMFLSLCFLYRDMLQHHWQKFKQAPIKGMLLVIIGMILLQLIITLTRKALPVVAGDGTIPDTDLFDNASLFYLFIVGFSPLFTALIEDIVFRYTLLQKLFIPNIPWRIMVVLLNSILFGLIHYYNFDENALASVSFMTAGLFLNLIYLWTRNIWPVLLIHILNNGLLSIGALFVLALFQKILL